MTTERAEQHDSRDFAKSALSSLTEYAKRRDGRLEAATPFERAFIESTNRGARDRVARAFTAAGLYVAVEEPTPVEQFETPVVKNPAPRRRPILLVLILGIGRLLTVRRPTRRRAPRATRRASPRH